MTVTMTLFLVIEGKYGWYNVWWPKVILDKSFIVFASTNQIPLPRASGNFEN